MAWPIDTQGGTMRHLLLVLATLAFSSYVAPARAADIEDLERQLAQAREAAPMVVKPFMAVVKPATYFGDYNPRPNTVYSKGETLHFYGEPKNLIYPKNAKGQFEPAFEVDVEIAGPGGQSMKKSKLMSFRLPTRSRAQDIYLNLELTLTSAPPGKYNVKFIVRDLNSKKSAAVDTDVTLK
jgi:hypothetical protein